MIVGVFLTISSTASAVTIHTHFQTHHCVDLSCKSVTTERHMRVETVPPPYTPPPPETTTTTYTTEYVESDPVSSTPYVDPYCESGGSGGYSADTGNGYYGAYQFDQTTWDAYAPEGYAGTNPASAPPEVQDAVAAAVPYDAWPNC